MAIVFNEEKIREAAMTISNIANGSFIEAITKGYNAVLACGENPQVEGIKEKFIKFQDHYNNVILPAVTGIYNNTEVLGDFGKHLTNMAMDTSIKAVDVDPVADAGFAEGMGL